MSDRPHRLSWKSSRGSSEPRTGFGRTTYADLEVLYDGERTSSHLEARATVRKMLDSQDKWASSALFVVDWRAYDNFKGKSVSYDQDRGPAM